MIPFVPLPDCWLEQWRWNPLTGQREFHRLIGDYLELAASVYVGRVGMLTFRIAGGHALASDIQRDDKFKVYRTRPDGTTYLFGSYYALDMAREIAENDVDHLTVVCYDRLHLLERFIVAYRAGIADRSQFQDLAEPALRNLVTYNATPAGVHDDNDPTSRLGDVPDDLWFSIAVEANGNRGGAIQYPCQFDTLLEALLEVAQLGGLDFDLVEGEEDKFTFRLYAPTLGEDRRSGAEPLEFSLANANMQRPKVRLKHSAFKNVAFAGGEGADEERVVVAVNSTRELGLTGAPFHAETFVDARLGKEDEDMIRSLGRRALLNEYAPVFDLEFVVIQTDERQFDRDYFLGWLGVATFAGYTQDVKIVGALLGYAPGAAETLEVLTETYG